MSESKQHRRGEVVWESFRSGFRELKQRIQQAMVGQDALIDDCLTAMFSQGHVLLQGVPGLGKTYLVTVIASALGLSTGRVQCTPDLMPSDVLGTHVVSQDADGRRVFRFEKGPVFRHLLLVDEINRATPKTQAGLLEVMQERGVTAGGEHFPVPAPFFVLATQNPVEMEGTYPLPEAQLDRFLFQLLVPFPEAEDLMEITRRTTGFAPPTVDPVMSWEDLMEFQRLLTEVPVAEPLLRYAASLILATHPGRSGSSPGINRYVAYGASPRGLQAIIRTAKVRCLLDGRSAVSTADIRSVTLPALRHRLIRNFEGEAENVSPDDLLRELLQSLPGPDGGIVC